MNWDQLKKGAGTTYQLEPIAAVLDATGRELGRANDDWILKSISPDAVATLQNTRTGHLLQLAKDHIVDFRSDPARSADGGKYGFLVLKMQVFLQSDRVFLRPNRGPGQPVVPAFAPRHLNSELEAELDRLIPAGATVFVIVTMGDSEAHAFAREVHACLESGGRKARLQERMGTPPIPPGQNINKLADRFEILIGARN